MSGLPAMPSSVTRTDMGRALVDVRGAAVLVETTDPLSSRMHVRFGVNQGVTVGQPVGGDMGPGTLNVEKAVYVGGGSASAVGASTGTNTPADPAGTSVFAGAMCGYAVILTPVTTGRVLVQFGGIHQSSLANGGVATSVYYGTGTPPATAAAVTGTLIGNEIFTIGPVAPANFVFTNIVLITGLTLGTAYWFDLKYRPVTGGQASVQQSYNMAIEL